MQRKAAAWEKYSKATFLDKIIHQLPEVTQRVSSAIAERTNPHRPTCSALRRMLTGLSATNFHPQRAPHLLQIHRLNAACDFRANAGDLLQGICTGREDGVGAIAKMLHQRVQGFTAHMIGQAQRNPQGQIGHALVFLIIFDDRQQHGVDKGVDLPEHRAPFRGAAGWRNL